MDAETGCGWPRSRINGSGFFRPLCPYRTRHFRHLQLKLLTTIGQSLSGRSNFPTYNPTKWTEVPDKISEALALSQNPQNTQNTLWLIEATPIETGDSLH
jgi:hypothetical protein